MNEEGIAMSFDHSFNLRRTVRRHAYWIPLLILTAWTLGPLLWTLSSSFKPLLEIYTSPPTLIPSTFTVQSYINAVTHQGFVRYFLNSLYLATASTILATIFSVFCAYALARYAFWLRPVVMMFIIVPRILPRAALIAPLYEIIARIGLLDTYAVLIITYTATAIPLATWILTGFIAAVPRQLEECAEIDGASIWRILRSIVIPVALPGIITVGLVSFVQAWKEFPFVLAFTTSRDMRTLPYQLYMMRDALGIQDWPLILAFTTLTILPLVLVFVRFEKHIVSGITRGAMKE